MRTFGDPVSYRRPIPPIARKRSGAGGNLPIVQYRSAEWIMIQFWVETLVDPRHIVVDRVPDSLTVREGEMMRGGGFNVALAKLL